MNNVISTTDFRKNISGFLDTVSSTGQVLTVGRRNQPDVVVMAYPKHYREDISELSNLLANNPAFDFLQHEKDIYSLDDIVETYGK